MRRGLLVFLLTILLSIPVVQDARAQGTLDSPTGTHFGLMLATHFGTGLASPGLARGLIGFKIQLEDINLGITPKIGLGVQTIRVPGTRDTRTLFEINFGAGVDYYIDALKVDRLRPYVGGDLAFGVRETIWSVTQTDFAVWLYPHMGAEYWLSKNFSLGANVGPDFTINTEPETQFGFGFNGVLHLTWYF